MKKYIVFLGTIEGGKCKEISGPIYETEFEKTASELSDDIGRYFQYQMGRHNGKPILCLYKEVEA